MSRDIRTGPELRDEAKKALARRLAHDGCPIPDALAAELLVILDSHQIRLTDGRTPPRGTGGPPSELPSDHPYHAARAALRGNDTQEAEP